MSLLIPAVAALTLGLGAAFMTAPRDSFETGIFIDAPPEQVWALLSDPVAHAAWNPMVQAVEGQFIPGTHIRLSMRTPSGGSMTFHPRVLAAAPGQELRWLGRLPLPRLFDGEHYFLLSPENGGTRLIQGERFRGVALWVMDVQQFRPAFEAANAALKAHAEARLAGSAALLAPATDRQAGPSSPAIQP